MRIIPESSVQTENVLELKPVTSVNCISRKVDTLLRLVGVDSLSKFNGRQILKGIEDCGASYKQKPFGKKFCGNVYELKRFVSERTRRHDVVCRRGISGVVVDFILIHHTRGPCRSVRCCISTGRQLQMTLKFS